MNVADLLRTIVLALVTHPDDVRVDVSESSHILTLTLRTHPNDTGKIIGTGGEVATDIRDILKAAGGKIQKRVDLNIVDTRPKAQPRVMNFEGNTSRDSYVYRKR